MKTQLSTELQTHSAWNMLMRKAMSGLRCMSLMLSCFLLLSLVNVTTSNAQTITTDRTDYWPGATAVFTGSGFLPGEDVVINVSKFSQDPWLNYCFSNWTVTADANGDFVTTWYVCIESLNLTLIVTADGQLSGLHAEAIFTDGAANLDQARNGRDTSPISPVDWVNGNAGSSNSHYVEGYSIPYRMVLTGLTAGTHTLDIEWDIRHSSKNAIDYITSFNRLNPHLTQWGHEAEDILPLLGTGLVSPSVITAPIPPPIVNSTAGTVGGLSQPITSFNSLPAGERLMTMYNGASIVSMQYIANSSGVVGGDLTASNSACRMRITFTTTNAMVVFAWGGHIARTSDWGAGQAAGGISGSPYHTRLIELDGSGGNQDRSLSAAAVLPPSCNIGGPTTVCTGSTNTYTGPTGTGYTYSWALVDNTSGASFNGATNGPSVSVISGNSVGSFGLEITVTGPLGSTSTCVKTITVNGVVPSCSVTSNVTCDGLSNGVITVTASGGTAPYTGTGVKTGLAAGTYTYTITDAIGCSATCSATVTQPSALNANCSVNSHVSCNGGNDGSASVVASGGTPPYTGDGTKSGLSAGTYTFTVTDANGCTASCTVTITQPTPLVPSCSVVNHVSCKNGNDGQANVTASGGTPPYTGTGAKTGLTAGTYTYTVTDANGCSATCSVTITEPTLLVATCTKTADASCNGASDGAATVSGSGGTPPYTGTGPKTGLAQGTYTYTITDANGCTASCTVTINQPTSLLANCSVTSQVSCKNGNDGAANVTASGGTPPYTGTGAKTGLTAGTYTYTVTDANGCSATCSVTITEPTLLVATCTKTADVSCFGGSDGAAMVSGSGGTPPYTGTGAKTGLAQGTYTYTITDANGCTASCTVTINQPTLLVANCAVYNHVSCKNGNDGQAEVTVSGGTPPYSGDGLKSGLSAGTYTYTVTDANGCSATCSVTITEPTLLVATCTKTADASCNGANDGAATVSGSGGTPPYSGTGPKTGLAAGTYTYTITDANGCTATCSVTIGQPSTLSASCTVSSHVSCKNGNDGSANVVASGGTPPYSGDGLKTGLSAGTYSYTVTDANGCSFTCSVTINEPTLLVATCTKTADVSCFGGSDGAAMVSGSGGTPPYTGTGAKTGLAQGTYTYTITDANGCTASCTVTINQPTLLVANCAVYNHVSCKNGNDGQAEVTVSGGTPPYSGDGLKSGLSAGTYTYTVTDANGCSATCSVTITEPTLLVATCTKTADASCNGANDGAATVSGSGGTPPYSGTGPKTGLAAGTYTYTITDANGCTATCSVTIGQPSTLTATCTVSSDVSCNGGNDGSANVVASGGTPPYSGDGLKTGLSAGTYSYTVTDANGCSFTCSVTINEPTLLQASCSQTTAVTCNGGQDGSATVTASGGTPPYTGTGLKPGLAAGTYTYTVTDSKGCSASCTVIINEPTRLSLNCTVSANVSCHGGSDGSANVSASGGTPPYTGTGAKTGLSAGTYTYTVTDANGCSVTCTVTITQPNALQANCSVTANVSCHGGSNGAAMVSGSGGTPPYTGIGAITGLAAGTYTYTITDANGCTATCSVTITQPDALTVTCEANNSTGVITSTPSGGTGAYAYLWSPGGATTQNMTATQSGTFTVQVTDANGCTATSTCTVIINCQGFRTQTQGGWGAPAKGNNPAMYLKNNFAAAFPAPNYATIGCATGNKLRLTSPAAVTAFLPSGSTARALPAGTLVNPGGTYSNVFAGQVMALTLSVGFDLYDANFSSATVHLEDLVIASGTFAGWSVKQVLAEANKKIGGCASIYSFSQLNDVVSKINENFVDGTHDNGFLRCPGSARGITSATTDNYVDENMMIQSYPNPFANSTTIEFMKLDEDTRITIDVYDMTGHLVASLFDAETIAGTRYHVTFDGSQLPSGIYIYRLVANNNLHTGRLIMMK